MKSLLARARCGFDDVARLQIYITCFHEKSLGIVWVQLFHWLFPLWPRVFVCVCVGGVVCLFACFVTLSSKSSLHSMCLFNVVCHIYCLVHILCSPPRFLFDNFWVVQCVLNNSQYSLVQWNWQRSVQWNWQHSLSSEMFCFPFSV